MLGHKERKNSCFRHAMISYNLQGQSAEPCYTWSVKESYSAPPSNSGAMTVVVSSISSRPSMPPDVSPMAFPYHYLSHQRLYG